MARAPCVDHVNGGVALRPQAAKTLSPGAHFLCCPLRRREPRGASRRSKKPRAREPKLKRTNDTKKARGEPLLDQVAALAGRLPFETRCVKVDGRIYGAPELCALCDAVGDEASGSSINWSTVAARLHARDVSFDALLTLRRAATRLEDEARAAEQQRSSSKSSSATTNTEHRRLSSPPRDLTTHFEADDDDDRATARRESSRWSPARCQALWRWVAYALTPPERTTEIDEVQSDDDDYVLDPFEFAYKAHGAESRKAAATILDAQREEPRREQSRLRDLEAAALLCASRTSVEYHQPQQRRPRPPEHRERSPHLHDEVPAALDHNDRVIVQQAAIERERNDRVIIQQTAIERDPRCVPRLGSQLLGPHPFQFVPPRPAFETSVGLPLRAPQLT